MTIFGDTFSKGSGLNDLKVKRLRIAAKRQLVDIGHAFGAESYRAKMDPSGPMMNVDSMFLWEPHDFTVTDGSHSRSEELLNLSLLRLAIGKKKIINDFVNCYICLNDHTLYRLIQRGGVDRLPLSRLSEDVGEWFPYAAQYLTSYSFLHQKLGQNVFIPYLGGALLAKMSLIEVTSDKTGMATNYTRVIATPWGKEIAQPPFDHILTQTENGKTFSTMLTIKTWIPESFFHREQWWAKFRIEEFKDEFAESFENAERLLIGDPRPISDEVFERSKSRVEDFGRRFIKIFGDKRWATACNWLKS